MTDYPSREKDGATWLRVCKSVDVGERSGHRVEIDIEHDLALFRVDGEVYCVSNVCPHKREAFIYDGFVEDGTVTCPLHGWRFSIKTGENTGNASSLGCYKTEEVNGYVWVSITEL